MMFALGNVPPAAEPLFVAMMVAREGGLRSRLRLSRFAQVSPSAAGGQFCLGTTNARVPHRAQNSAVDPVAAGNLADELGYCILHPPLGVILLDHVDLPSLTQERATVLPLRGVVVWTIEVAGELDLPAGQLRKRNSERVAKLRPPPLGLCVEIVKNALVVELRMVNDLQDGIEVH